MKYVYYLIRVFILFCITHPCMAKESGVEHSSHHTTSISTDSLLTNHYNTANDDRFAPHKEANIEISLENYNGDLLCRSEKLTVKGTVYTTFSTATVQLEYLVKGTKGSVSPTFDCWQNRDISGLSDDNSCWKPLKSITINNIEGAEADYSHSFILSTLNLNSNNQFVVRAKYSNGGYTHYSSTTSIVNVAPRLDFLINITPTCTSQSGTGDATISLLETPLNEYSYFLNDGNTRVFNNDTHTITGLSEGNYTIQLRDNVTKCISSTKSFTITQYPSSSLAYSKTDADCPTGNGLITATYTGGNPNEKVTFTISGSANASKLVTRDGNGTATASFNLQEGTYTLSASDGCMEPQKEENIKINAPPAIAASVAKNMVSCDNVYNGKLTLNISAGPGKYDFYLYERSTAQAKASLLNTTNKNWTPNFNYVKGREYYLVAKGGTTTAQKDCNVYTSGYYPMDGAALALTKTVTQAQCAGEKASIKLTASGGSGNYRYTLKGDNGYDQNNTQGVFSNLADGEYTATVVNEGISCNDKITLTGINIQAPKALSLSITKRNISCYQGQTDGKITATVGQGTPPYTYQWQKYDGFNWKVYPGSSSSIANLAEGRYRVIVKDKNNCSKQAEAEIKRPDERLRFTTVNISHVSCKGANDGRLNPQVRGGWGSYTYFYAKNQSNTFTSFDPAAQTFAPGNYTLKVQDALLCEDEYDVSISEPAQPLSFTYTLSEYNAYALSCSNGNDGSIMLNATGGNGSPFDNKYLYALDDGAFQETPLFENLTPGSYSIKVKDMRGCVVEKNISLNAPPPITITSVDKNHIQCFGEQSGYLNFSISGGIAPYQYRLDHGAWQDNASFEQLASGEHMLEVQDAFGCIFPFVETITTNSEFIVSLTPTDVRCYGEDNGLITAIITGGVPPYTYRWEDRTETTADLQNLSPGTYTLFLSDAEGCQQTVSTTIYQPEQELFMEAVPTDVRCYGENNGSIKLHTSGGNPPYQYSLDEGNTFQPESIFNNLIPGAYEILVEDSKGCQYTAQTQIQEPDSLILSIVDKQDILCHGEYSGSITVSASGGNLPYSYSLDDSNFQSSPHFEALAAGAYTLRVRDHKGCEDTISFNLTQPAVPLSLRYQTTMIACKGSATGAIQTQISGGTPPYQYQWLTLNKISADVDSVPAGLHIIEITDAHACILRDSILITEPDLALEGYITEQQNVSCHGLSDGAFSFSAQGGYPPYQYAFQGGAYHDVLHYENLPAGEYRIAIKDTMNCIFTLPIEIIEPDPLKADVLWQDHVHCFGDSDASFELSIEGGTPPYAYSLDSGNTWQSESIFEYLSVDKYQALVKDAHQCQTTVEISITQPTLLEARIEKVLDASCQQANGAAKVIASGGTLPYTYRWEDQTGSIVATEAYPTNLKSGIYTVTVTDAKSCVLQLVQVIQDEDGPKSMISDKHDASCFDMADGSATVIASEGAGDYQYLWSDPAAQTYATAVNLVRGSYFVTVKDSRGCISISEVFIDSPPALALESSQLTQPSCFENSDGSIEVKMTGGVAPYAYHWSPSIEAEGGKAIHLSRGTYTLSVTDAIGCSFTQTFDLVPPQPLTLTVDLIQAPSCHLGNDGLAKVKVSGGTAPYRYSWSDAQKQSSAEASGLMAGTYQLLVTDSLNCQASMRIEVPETPALALSLPSEVTLCMDQSVILDAGISDALYWWTKDEEAFSDTQSIEIREGGTYQLQLTDKNGCTAQATTVVKAYDILFEANFLHASELGAGDTLLLTEVCYPMPDSVQWVFPENMRLLEQENFNRAITSQEESTFQIKLIGYYNVCTDSVTKSVTFLLPDQSKSVENARRNDTPKGIESIEVFPNPTTGMFSVKVKLHDTADLYGFLYHINGDEVERVQVSSQKEYSLSFDIAKYPPGVYLLRLATTGDQQTVRILLQ